MAKLDDFRFTVTFRMVPGEKGWQTPSSASLDYGDRRMGIRLAEGGGVVTTFRAIQSVDRPDAQPLFTIQKNSKSQIERVELTVQIPFDTAQFETAVFDAGDFERAVEIASSVLLQRFPETRFVKKT
jgi:hypothetical protein